MVDFNWYRTSTDEDWHVRAARLRAEIYTNKYWYNVITQAVPRYSSNEDAEKVSTLLNTRMAATRRMERELAWLEESIESTEDLERRKARSAPPSRPVAATCDPKRNHNVAIGVACLLAQGPLLGLLKDSVLGGILLVLSFAKLCHFAVLLLGNARQWFAEIRTARDDLRSLRQMSEPELIRWGRAVRLHEYHRSADSCVTTS